MFKITRKKKVSILLSKMVILFLYNLGLAIIATIITERLTPKMKFVEKKDHLLLNVLFGQKIAH